MTRAITRVSQRRLRLVEGLRSEFKEVVTVARMPAHVPMLWLMSRAAAECARRHAAAELRAASAGMSIGERRRWLADAEDSATPSEDVRLRFLALSNAASRKLDALGRIVLPERMSEFDECRVRLMFRPFPFAVDASGLGYVELQRMGPRKTNQAGAAEHRAARERPDGDDFS